jgi:hypothetical protein
MDSAAEGSHLEGTAPDFSALLLRLQAFPCLSHHFSFCRGFEQGCLHTSSSSVVCSVRLQKSLASCCMALKL